ncbi:MAG TPA: zinc-binding dehydrogenase [Thermoplasmata archaeon]|nr:zinc-binding dehydrogenase [Thermoplasmata archaeon]
MDAYRLKAKDVAQWEDVPRPTPSAGEVLIAIKANGLCRSDVHALRGVLKQEPSTMGHEGAGVVEAFGPGVAAPRVGDRVVVNYVNPDGTCPMCRGGREEICERTPLGFGVDGVFAEAIALPAANVAVLPETIPFEEGAVLGCAGCTAWAATLRSGLRPGHACMIIGLGGVGMQGVQTAKLFGASPIVAVDVSEPKLALAQRLGADVLVNASREDPVRVARSLGDGRGVDVAFEYIGLPQTLNQAIRAVRGGGTAVMVGIPAGDVSFNGLTFNLDAKTLLAIQGHTNRDLREVLAARARGLLRTGETITHRLPFKEIERAFAILERQEGDPVRVVLRH